MNNESFGANINKDVVNSPALKMRTDSPERMAALEQNVRDFAKKVMVQGETLSDKSVGLIANAIVNKMATQPEGSSQDELDKMIEEALMEGVDVRLKTAGFENMPSPRE
jgi:hypothetical protein